MKMTIEVKPFPLHEPFVITGYTFHVTEVVWVTLADGDAVGRGEAVGSYYLRGNCGWYGGDTRVGKSGGGGRCHAG